MLIPNFFLFLGNIWWLTIAVERFQSWFSFGRFPFWFLTYIISKFVRYSSDCPERVKEAERILPSSQTFLNLRHLAALFACPLGLIVSLRAHISSSERYSSNSPKNRMISSFLPMWYCSFLNLLKLSRMLNCCHLFAKLIFPSSSSGFPICTNVRSWRTSPM